MIEPSNIASRSTTQLSRKLAEIKEMFQTRFVMFVVILVTVGTSVAFGQNRTSTTGYMPTGLAPGSPAGSFGLGNFDTINPFNGNLNFKLPLASVKGRGLAAYAVELPINLKWNMLHQWGGESAYYYSHNPFWSPNTYGRNYGPGSLSVRAEYDGSGCGPGESGPYSILWRLIYVESDGTEHEFLDEQTDGAVTAGYCGYTPNNTNRGTVFNTYNGTFITFVSDSTVYDSTGLLTGYLKFTDGTFMRVESSRIVWISDSNGNRVNFTYSSGVFTKATDSLGRETTFAYDQSDSGQYGLHDQISYKGTAGATRTIRVSYKDLVDVLRSDYSIQTSGALWGGSGGSNVNIPHLVSAVWLPDGRSYKFRYNSHGELARVELPTGGAVEYDWGASLSGGNSYGIVQIYKCLPMDCLSQQPDINRRVLTKRVYPGGGTGNTYSLKTTFGQVTGQGTSTSNITIKNYDVSNNLLTQTKHYFHGHPIPDEERPVFTRPDWNEGLEFKTEFFDIVSGSPVLKRTVEKTWQQYGDGNPRDVETITTLEDTDQVSKVTSINPADSSIGYDQYNNPTDVWEYDFGSGSPGAFLRRTHTDYVTSSTYTSHSGPNLRRLPLEMRVSSDSAGYDIVSRTKFEYDNYTSATDPNHDPLESRSSVTGHDSTNYGTGFTYRGNVTSVTRYANADAETGAVTAYSLYDMLGNLIKTIDARSKATTISYADNFGAADNDATTNSTPSQISGYSTFAFPTSTTNPLSWTAHIQYDYFTGKPVNTQDVNGMKSKVLYEDPLDRATQTVVALTTGSQAQTKIEYDDDSDRQIIVKSDLNVYDDKLLKTVSFYDGLGRTKETRTYEADGNYRAVQTEFDALGRASRVSNPFRPADTKYWTESRFDALGRIIEIETLDDDAKIVTAYDGNRTIVTDQAGKRRISLTNAIGQLKDIWEIRPSSDGDTVSVTFPGSAYSGVAYGYKTSYGYDVLGNLTSVDQGSIDRSFEYDSLSRLLSATNPESGETEYEYDANGNLTEKTDARGIVTTYAYDDLNRVTQRAYATPSPTPANYQATPTVTYTYDNLTNSKGRMTKVESSVSTTEYTEFDILGRVLKSKQTTDGTTYGNGSTDSQMTYAYNLAGMLIEQQYPSGRRVQNVLDNDGQLEMVKSRKNTNSGYWAYANNITYSAAGAVTSMQLGNGTWESTGFNNRLQPTQIALGTLQNGYDKLKLNYSYGDWVSGSIDATKNNGNIVQQVITVPNSTGASNAFTATQKYYYDSLNRIDDSTETISTETWQQDFSYDRYGNRSFVEANTDFNGFLKQCSGSMCSDLKKRMNPAIGSANRLATSDGYAFDAAGNTKEDPDGRQFTYDGENKQVKVLDDADTIVGQYWYDGDGKRVKKYVAPGSPDPGEVTVFVYDVFGKLVAEYSTAVESTNAKVAYLTNDHLGSPRINTEKNGGVTARHDYHPFGEEIVTDARTGHAEYGDDKVRKQFTGYERDKETDLDYAQARTYGWSHGRFTSADPLASSAAMTDPQTLNRYAYVVNSPLKYNDPTGMYLESATACGRRCSDSREINPISTSDDHSACQAAHDAYDETANAPPQIVVDSVKLVLRTVKRDRDRNLLIIGGQNVYEETVLAVGSAVPGGFEVNINSAVDSLNIGDTVYIKVELSIIEGKNEDRAVFDDNATSTTGTDPKAKPQNDTVVSPYGKRMTVNIALTAGPDGVPRGTIGRQGALGSTTLRVNASYVDQYDSQTNELLKNKTVTERIRISLTNFRPNPFLRQPN